MKIKAHYSRLLFLPLALFIQSCNSDLKSVDSVEGNSLSSEAPLSRASLSAQKVVTNCSATKLEEALEPATADRHTVRINCNLDLAKGDIITKVVEFYGPSASGVTLNCNGGTIDGITAKNPEGRKIIMVRPQKSGDTWLPPVNVTIKNCQVYGSARIWWGNHLNSNVKKGNGDVIDYEIYDSSRRADHVAYMQSLAPRGIKFSKVTFYGTGGGNMLYFGPGVTESSVVDSKFLGKTDGGAIYLEAESARNVIKNNLFDVSTKVRELISVDASAENTITNNTFRNLKNGGIFLYRNCGEQGVIRHLAPDNNVIVNNIFDYSKTTSVSSGKYGIFVSSRTGKERLGRDNDFCPLDNGFAYGSSADDRSPARNNLVAQNRFLAQDPDKMIKIANGYSNIVRENEKVTLAPARSMGCFVINGAPKDFIKHGESVQMFLVKGVSTCTGKKLTCNDGITSQTTVNCTKPKNVCTIALNSSNRLVVRNADGSGIAYFDSKQRTQAESKLRELILNKTCDPTSLPPLPTAEECKIELNGNNRLVIRTKSGTGLAFFASSEKKQAEAKLKQLRTAKVCL